MGSARIYAKTPAGDEAVRQSTRVVQRNLRLVLVQVDGKLSVDELIAKIGNARLVESAINDLERGGFIVPQAEAAAAWAVGVPPEKEELHSAISQFSTFGERAPTFVSMEAPGAGPASVFSAFGKPVLPASEQEAPPKKRKKLEEETAEPGPGWQWRIFPLLGGAFMVLVALLVLLGFFFP